MAQDDDGLTLRPSVHDIDVFEDTILSSPHALGALEGLGINKEGLIAVCQCARIGTSVEEAVRQLITGGKNGRQNGTSASQVERGTVDDDGGG